MRAFALGHQLGDRDTVIRNINRAIMVFYVLLFLEGVLRKWILPQLSAPIFFIKDPVLLYLYFICWKHRMFPKNILFHVSVFLAAVFFLLAMVQMVFNQTSMIIVLYGWRNYFMYMPLAFIMQAHMDKSDLIRFARFTCYIGIPIAILTYIQHISPPDAFINKNAGEDSGAGFTVIADVVRPYGPFSFVSGMVFFTPSLFSFLLYNFFLPQKEKFLPPVMNIICWFAFASNVAVSGSRGTYANVFLIAIFLFLGLILLINKKEALKALMILTITGIVAITLYQIVFSRQIDIINQRVENAKGEGGALRRFALGFADFYQLPTDLPFVGQGIGLGSSGGSFLATGKVQFTISESDWGRNVIECGFFFGFLYILYRIVLCVYISVGAMLATIKSTNPIALVFIGFEIQNLLFGQMVSVGTNLVYAWLFLGICLLINKIYLEQTKEPYAG